MILLIVIASEEGWKWFFFCEFFRATCVETWLLCFSALCCFPNTFYSSISHTSYMIFFYQFLHMPYILEIYILYVIYSGVVLPVSYFLLRWTSDLFSCELIIKFWNLIGWGLNFWENYSIMSAVFFSIKRYIASDAFCCCCCCLFVFF